MRQQVLVALVLVDATPRVIDQLRVAEVGMQSLILRTEPSCPGQTGERDDVRVVRTAAVSYFAGLGLDFVTRYESGELCALPVPERAGSIADPV